MADDRIKINRTLLYDGIIAMENAVILAVCMLGKLPAKYFWIKVLFGIGIGLSFGYAYLMAAQITSVKIRMKINFIASPGLILNKYAAAGK